MSVDLSTYLVTDTDLCGERGVLGTVVAAVQGGVIAVVSAICTAPDPAAAAAALGGGRR